MYVRRLAGVAAVMLGVTVPATAALAASSGGPGTLVGEQFSGTARTHCTSRGLWFMASGTATGPYNGTFREIGKMSFPQPTGGAITSLVAIFAIYQGNKRVVTGSKTLSYSNGATCNRTNQLANAFVNWQAHYKQTNSSSSGQGFLSLGGSDPSNDTFQESFVLNE